MSQDNPEENNKAVLSTKTTMLAQMDMKCGGLSETKGATPEIQKMCDEVSKNDVK